MFEYVWICLDRLGHMWASLDRFGYFRIVSDMFVNVLLGLDKFRFVLGYMFVLFICLLDLWFGSIFSKLAKFFMNWAKKLRLRHRCKVPKLLGILHCYRA